MHTLRRLRSIGRFMAAWFLLWACVMAAAPIPALRDGGHAAAAGARLDLTAHALHQPPHCGDADVGPPAAHQGHEPGSASHCPMCMQAAAPPPPHDASDLVEPRPAHIPESGYGVALRVRAAMPPPARGPPVFS
jgi:hypothetical protein